MRICTAIWLGRAHLETLADHIFGLAAGRLLRQLADQRRSGRAGRRVFATREVGREHSRGEIAAVFVRRLGVDIDRASAEREHLGPSPALRLHALQCGRVLDRYEVIDHARRIDRRLEEAAADVFGFEPEPERESLLVGRCARDERQLRQGETGVTGALVELFDDAGNDTDLLLETDRRAARLETEHHRSTDGRMPGKGQLARRCEDANGGTVAVGLRLGDEHRLRQIELASDALHLVVEQSVGTHHDGERIAVQPLAREHIQQKIIKLHLTLRAVRCGSFPSLSSNGRAQDR